MRDVETLRNFRTFYYIPIVVALVAVLPVNSFEFYMAVRWVLFCGFISTVLFLFINAEELFWYPLIAIIGAVDFNPFNITTNTKSWWIVIDLLSALFFYAATKSLTTAIEDIDREAQTAEQDAALEKERQKRVVEYATSHDREVLEYRKKHKITPEQLKEWAKDPMVSIYHRDRFTLAEWKEIQRKNARGDFLAFAAVALIITAIAVGYHYLKSH